MGPFGVAEIVFIFVVALLIFGPKKLPEIGKTLGKGMREFKKATNDLKSNWEENLRDVESPVQDLKDTYNEVRADVESSTSLEAAEFTPPAGPGETPEGAKPATMPEETKPDAHTN